MNEIDKFREAYLRLPFHEKVRYAKSVNQLTLSRVEGYADSLTWDGYLTTVVEKAVHCDEGDSYVYLWRHAWGEPFYVGHGKGDRWLNKNERCDNFYPHIDKGDAVPYLVLCGVDSKTACEYERYVSVNLVRAGFDLANSDNNPDRETRTKDWDKVYERFALLEEKELTEKVCDAVVSILSHEPRCDYRITETFVKRYGNDYFSRNFGSR